MKNSENKLEKLALNTLKISLLIVSCFVLYYLYQIIKIKPIIILTAITPAVIVGTAVGYLMRRMVIEDFKNTIDKTIKESFDKLKDK